MDRPSSLFDEILQYSQRGYSNIQGPIPVARRLENGLDGVSYQKNPRLDLHLSGSNSKASCDMNCCAAIAQNSPSLVRILRKTSSSYKPNDHVSRGSIKRLQLKTRNNLSESVLLSWCQGNPYEHTMRLNGMAFWVNSYPRRLKGWHPH